MLAHYLVQLQGTDFEFTGKQVLELGAGTNNKSYTNCQDHFSC